jgi:hypothetical protein
MGRVVCLSSLISFISLTAERVAEVCVLHDAQIRAVCGWALLAFQSHAGFHFTTWRADQALILAGKLDARVRRLIWVGRV